jgi:hypothetical protein
MLPWWAQVVAAGLLVNQLCIHATEIQVSAIPCIVQLSDEHLYAGKVAQWQAPLPSP